MFIKTYLISAAVALLVVRGGEALRCFLAFTQNGVLLNPENSYNLIPCDQGVTQCVKREKYTFKNKEYEFYGCKDAAEPHHDEAEYCSEDRCNEFSGCTHDGKYYMFGQERKDDNLVPRTVFRFFEKLKARIRSWVRGWKDDGAGCKKICTTYGEWQCFTGCPRDHICHINCDEYVVDENGCQTCDCKPEILLSFKKPSMFSSKYHQDKYSADNVVDGIGNNVARSGVSKLPWFEVNLGSIYVITSVRILNSKYDNCTFSCHLYNAVITISNVSKDFEVCKIFDKITTPNKIKQFQCDQPIRGQFVRLTQIGDWEESWINIHQFEVYGEEILLSFKKPSMFSSKYHQDEYSADNAVDDIRNNVARSGVSKLPWFEVNLGSRYVITSVRILNSKYDNCTFSCHLHNAVITISDVSKDLKLSTQYKEREVCKIFDKITTPNKIKRFQCDQPIRGQFVRLTQIGDREESWINIHQFEVYGEECEDTKGYKSFCKRNGFYCQTYISHIKEHLKKVCYKTCGYC